MSSGEGSTLEKRCRYVYGHCYLAALNPLWLDSAARDERYSRLDTACFQDTGGRIGRGT